MTIFISIKGGPGSGNWGHRGVPGKVGGSSPRGSGVVGVTLKPLSYKERLDLLTYDGKRYIGMDERVKLKAEVVDDIATRSGLSKADVNYTMEKWAGTANDTDLDALSLQETAAELFGLELSDWQTGNLAHFAGRSSQRLTKDQQKRFLTAMYDNTQSRLKELVGDSRSITVYRGYLDESLELDAMKGDSIRLGTSPLSSWSLDEDIARKFMGDAVVYESQSFLFRATIPLKSIISTSITGMGAFSEKEVVSIGNAFDVNVEEQFEPYADGGW